MLLQKKKKKRKKRKKKKKNLMDGVMEIFEIQTTVY